MPGTYPKKVQFVLDDTNKQQCREIARDIAVELLRKTGVSEYADTKLRSQIADAAIEITRKIAEAFPVR